MALKLIAKGGFRKTVAAEEKMIPA